MTQRVALVTGAMGGIGTAICQELAKAGHKVVAAYHPEFDKPVRVEQGHGGSRLQRLSSVLPATSPTTIPASLMVAEAEAKAGPIDILVNNAGITRDKMFARMEEASSGMR
jgi:acetoacetyl-CoA reductase